jgi:hypothetical protein
MYTEKIYELTWRDVSRSWQTTLSLNVRNFSWLENVHYQRATHIVYSRCAEGEKPDDAAIRKMAMEFRLEAAEMELTEMRHELARKEAIVRHMENELAE